MFVLSQQDNALFRGIATLLSVALVLYAVGAAYVRTAHADNVTDVYDLLTTSATSTASGHTIEFVTPNGVASGETITVTFPDSFTGTSSVVLADLDLEVNGVDQTVVDPAAAANQWDWNWNGGNTLTFTSGGGTALAASNATITIQIGSTAAGGTDRLVNPPTQASYEIPITAGSQDSGNAVVAIVDSVYITASVGTQFDFTVYGFSSAGTDVNGSSTTATGTATTIPFGELSAGTPVIIAQDLTVQTNAINGFVVTAEVDHQLESSTGADIDAFDESVFGVPAFWNSPSGQVLDENTWGHWGWTSEDSDTTRPPAAEFNSGEWEGASTSPAVLFSHTGPADASTPGVGSTTVGFQAEITALQEAGDDYEAILTYIATPTF